MQGQSESNTPIKQADFRDTARMLLHATRNRLTASGVHPSHLYVDLNAGCGRNEVTGDDGSPVIYAKLVREMGLPVDAYLFERDPEAARALDRNMAAYRTDCQRYTILCADHMERMPLLMAELSRDHRRRHGIVYSDPNGADVPFDLLAAIAEVLPTTDLVASINATAIKRCRGAMGEKLGRYRPLCDSLDAVPKRNRWVRCPVGAWGWTMAVLTNWTPKGPPPRGFYPHTSREGQAILNRLSWSESEREALGIPDLPVPKRTTRVVTVPQLNLEF